MSIFDSPMVPKEPSLKPSGSEGLTKENCLELAPKFYSIKQDYSDFKYHSQDSFVAKVEQMLDAGIQPYLVGFGIATSLGFFDTDSETFADMLGMDLKSTPNIGSDIMAKRWCFNPAQFPKMSQTDRDSIRRTMEIALDRKKYRKKGGTEYSKSLKTYYRYLKDTLNCLPNSIIDLLSFKDTRPEIINRLFPVTEYIFPITDGGLQERICNKTISSQTWMLALALHFTANEDLSFSSEGAHGILSPEMTEKLNRSWPSIVAFGLLLHQLEILQNPAITLKLYEMNREPSKVTNELKAQKKEIDQLKQELNLIKRKNDSLEQDNRQLRQRLDLAPTSRKDVDGIIERHQQTIRDQNAEIDRMKTLMRQMEENVAELEHQLYLKEAAEHQDKPWMDIELPETGVLFVGGNPNANKKWRNKYPKWTFVSTENPNAALPGKVDVIFLCVDHKCSHPLWYRVNEIYQNRTRMCYVQATNLDRLNEEMHYEYWKLLNKK